jgi:hypothetical protein
LSPFPEFFDEQNVFFGNPELDPEYTDAFELAMYFYRAPMNFERGRFSSWKMASVTLKQKLWEDRASLSLRFADPFDTMGFRVEVGGDNVLQVTERDFDARAIHLTFQYNFGRAPKVRQPRPEPAQEPTGGFP